MALSELGKRAKKAIALKGLKPTVSANYGLDYQKKMLRQLERIVQGKSNMSIENQTKLYKNLTNSILKHSKEREAEAIGIQLKKWQGANVWKIFTKKQGRLQIGSKVKLHPQILAKYAKIATGDPKVYIQSLINERQGFIDKVMTELGVDISDLTDTEWRLIQNTANAHEDYHGKYSGWYWVLHHLDEVYSMSLDTPSLIENILQGDALSLIIYERIKTPEEKQMLLNSLINRVAERNTVIENANKFNDIKESVMQNYKSVTDIMEYYMENVNEDGTMEDFLEWCSGIDWQ